MTVLCTPPVRRVFRFVVEPKMEWAFRRTAATDSTETRGGTRTAAGR